jgi:thioester reductase-like protein
VAIFLTGGTGYIGAHVAANLLDQHDAALNLLVRGRDQRDAELRLWNALQLHMPFLRHHSSGSIRAITIGSCTAPIR